MVCLLHVEQKQLAFGSPNICILPIAPPPQKKNNNNNTYK